MRAAFLGLTLMLGGCAATEPFGGDGPPEEAPDTSTVREPTPREEPRSRYGNPASYEVHGQRYTVMESADDFVQRGIASWYGKKFHGRRTSSGEKYDMYAMTAAHKRLPLPSYVRVRNLRNGREVTVRVNDRGPFVDNRIIDLSYTAASRLDMLDAGTAPVEIRIARPEKQADSQAAQAEETTQASSKQAVSYFIQLGAFADRDNADRLKARASETHPGTEVHVTPVDRANGADLYRVRLGPLESIAAVDRLTERLAKHGLANTHVVVE